MSVFTPIQSLSMEKEIAFSNKRRQRVRLKNFFPRVGLEEGLHSVQAKIHEHFPTPVYSDVECEDVGIGFIISLTVQESSNVFNAQMFLP